MSGKKNKEIRKVVSQLGGDSTLQKRILSEFKKLNNKKKNDFIEGAKILAKIEREKAKSG
jgi:hypothetical protein